MSLILPPLPSCPGPLQNYSAPGPRAGPRRRPACRAPSSGGCCGPPVHLKLRGRVDDGTERLAIRAALGAAHLFGLATGSHLRSLGGSKDLVVNQEARLEEANLRARLAREIVEILIRRFQKIPDKHRPYYSPNSRFRILELKSLLGWSAKQAARVFLVCPNTILNWERHVDPDARAVGSTVKPTPPIRRLADVVRNLAQTMARLGCGGQDMIAAILARAGWKLSARSVRRFVKERPTSPPAVPPARPQKPVVAHFVNHVWMMDVTIVKSFLGLSELHVAGVFDAFSRVPLSLQVLDTRPKASDMVRLLRPAIKAFGQPKYLITDLGSEFTGRIFAKTLSRLGIIQRFASRHNLYATARLERFWRTLKDTASLRLQLPLTRQDLERRLEPTLAHYLLFRPHQGLHGATPAEAFLGIEPAHHSAGSPPRGRPRERLQPPPFTVEYLDQPERRLPILESVA